MSVCCFQKSIWLVLLFFESVHSFVDVICSRECAMGVYFAANVCMHRFGDVRGWLINVFVVCVCVSERARVAREHE